jgi:hypothetical protein
MNEGTKEMSKEIDAVKEKQGTRRRATVAFQY